MLKFNQMATMCSTSPCSSSFRVFLLLLLLLSQVCSRLALSHSTVKFLPGLQGPLPFHLETGYVGVGESEDVQLFYYFVKSERSPKEDPLMLWLTGGPGCSAFSALAFEIGPFNFRAEEYNGSLPTLVLNPHSWSKVSSIIFLDFPAGTGFSYTKLPIATQRSDSTQIHHALQFFRKWLIDHPEFLSNSVYIGGDSYSGMIVPPVALEILKGNEDSVKPSINFQSLKNSCGGDYYNADPSKKICARNIRAFRKCVSGIGGPHILEPSCTLVSPKPEEIFGRRSLNEMSESLLASEPPLPTIGCRNYVNLLAHYWANDDTVRKALGIRKASIGKWQRCSNSLYIQDIQSSLPFLVNLSTKGCRALVYSGDHDFLIPFYGTQAWIRSLNYSIVDEWRQWPVEGQVAGYTRAYSNGMTSVKGGGHTAPEYKPKECFGMFERWISQKPL